MANLDRLKDLLKSTVVTGIDFVYVDRDNQTTLYVHFLKPPDTAPDFTDFDDPAKIRIYSLTGGETLPEVPVNEVKWVQIEPNGKEINPPALVNVLRIITKVPGDFSRYALHIEDSRIDTFFNDVEFTFKAGCKSHLDCRKRTAGEEGREWVDYPVDYQAKDFWSFRRALLDFASQRYPYWQDRLEADAGIMMAETLSALADEMAYYQDRVGREAALETATQRRSLRAHARLVDYNVSDGLGASSWLNVWVKNGPPRKIKAGTRVTDLNGPAIYEVGHNLEEVLKNATYDVDPCRNEFIPHRWDDNDMKLRTGSTHLFLQGAHSAHIVLDDYAGNAPGKWMLLLERPADPAELARAWMVRVVKVGPDETDPVFQDAMVRIDWEPAQALPFSMELADLTVHGNMVPISAGVTKTQRFSIVSTSTGGPQKPACPKAVEREGSSGSVSYRFSLPDSDQKKLVWLGVEPRKALPEINLCELEWDGAEWKRGTNIWTWRRTLVGENSSQSTDTHYILEDGYWNRVVGYRQMDEPDEIIHEDYVHGRGLTIRFGDGDFGKLPSRGTMFEVMYRLGNGVDDDVSAGTLCRLESDMSFINSVSNPFDITTNKGPESPEEIRQFAPEEFRTVTYRAVRPEDYAEAAKRLKWVQNAGGAFRYTGSWLSSFVTPDPLGTYFIDPAQRIELEMQLDRFRQAGRETYVIDPVYAVLDMIIALCVEPNAYIGEVEERALKALFGTGGPQSRKGFFSPDNFTFGTPLMRSQLEKILQDVQGVRTVLRIRFRRRGKFRMRDFNEMVYMVGDNEVIRVENNPFFPEAGSVKLEMSGGV